MSPSALRRAAVFLVLLATVFVGVPASPSAVAEPPSPPLLNGVFLVKVNYFQRTVNGASSPSQPVEMLFGIQTACGSNAGCTGMGVVMVNAQWRNRMEHPDPYAFHWDPGMTTWVGISNVTRDCGSIRAVQTGRLLTLQQQPNGLRGLLIEDTPPACGGLAQTPVEAFYAAPLPQGLTFEDAG